MQLVPRLKKSVTAYELLNIICRLILEEPKRYNQGDWLKLKKQADRSEKKKFPACGTIGCVAGWVDTLTLGPIRALRIFKDVFEYDAVPAARTLGLVGRQAEQLFSGDALTVHEWTDNLKPGTRAYARAGVRHIRAFQKEHELQLKSTVVNPARRR